MVHWPRSCRFLDHSERLERLHVADLRDAALHDEEVRVVDIQADGVEEVLHACQLSGVSIDEVFVASADDDLACHRDLGAALESDGTLRRLPIVEHDRDGSLGDARLTLLVHKLLQAVNADLAGQADRDHGERRL